MDGGWDSMNLPQNEEQSNLEKVNVEEENGVKTFRVKNYIPKRSTRKFLEPPYNIGIAIIFILIIIIIILASLKNKNIVWNCPNETTTQEIIFDVPTELILVEKNRFYTYDPRKDSLKLLLEVKKPVQNFDIGVGNSLYWIEANSSNIMSLSQYGNGTGKNVNVIFDETRVKPFAIAVDSINHNLYIVDESMPGLIVINTETKYYALMLTADWASLRPPRYIALDSEEGIMFIASTKMIKRANMDGTDFISIVSNRVISGMTLDPKRDIIFLIHNGEIIQNCNYFGMACEELLVDSVPILDLSSVDGYLFWLRKSSQDEKATQLWRCKVQNWTCIDHAVLPNVGNSIALIKAGGPVRISGTKQQSAPSNRQQKCDHITLPAAFGQTSCLCNMSSQLIFNKKCEPVSQFVLYTINGVTRSRTLDMSQRIIIEPFWPTPYHVGKLSLKTQIDFDYDLENDDFYFSDDTAIYKIKLKVKNPRQEIVLISDDTSLFIEDLAYDWLTGNMYYSRRSNKSNGKHSLAVFNVKKGWRMQKTLKYFDYDLNFGLEAAAYGLAVYPSRGVLFFTAGEAGRRFIYQTTMNGTEVSKFTNVRYVHEYRLIGVDYDRNRLYWISSENSVTHAKFDGTDRKDIASRYLRHVKTVSVSGQWMYLSNLDTVWRLNKDSGLDYAGISLLNLESQNVSGARIISQAQIVGNPCRNRNGGCEQFCFYGTKATCDCADGLKVTPEGACK